MSTLIIKYLCMSSLRNSALVKNVVDCEIDSLSEDVEKMSMDSPEQEEKLREDPNGEVQEVQVEVQLSQPLSKD